MASIFDAIYENIATGHHNMSKYVTVDEMSNTTSVVTD